jgi:hypothetical protein
MVVMAAELTAFIFQVTLALLGEATGMVAVQLLPAVFTMAIGTCATPLKE